MAIHRAFKLTSIIPLLLVWVFAMAAPVHAITLLRDADVEHGLKQLATPILKAAGLSPNRVKILVVDDPKLNAFVVSQDAIFIHYGLLSKLTTSAQLQGVIAHEAAHIANGHLTRRLTNLSSARNAAALGLALAIATAAAAGNADVAAPVAAGLSGSAQRAFFKHTRAEESSADAAALRYMRSAQVPSSGLLQVFEIFRGQSALAETRQDPYVRSHPLPRDRVRAVAAASSVDKNTATNQTYDYWFARVKGKLTAFKRKSKWTLRRAGDSGYGDVKAIRIAMAHYRDSKTKKALRTIDGAIQARPKDPFLYDLKGQIQYEAGQFGAAAQTLSQAVRLAPNDPLILSGLGRALKANGQPKQALGYLEKSRGIDYRDGSMLRDLAATYAATGQNGMASLVTAERYALRGRLDTAGIHAKRASDLLPTGSGGWQRAQDVLSASQRFSKKRKR